MAVWEDAKEGKKEMARLQQGLEKSMRDNGYGESETARTKIYTRVSKQGGGKEGGRFSQFPRGCEKTKGLSTEGDEGLL